MASSIKHEAQAATLEYYRGRKTKPTSKTRKKTMYTQHGHESMFDRFSFFIPQSNVECYTLESDISIGSGSFAASGQSVW